MIDIKCPICSVPIKGRYYHDHRHVSKRRKLLKEAMLRGWATFLDEVSRLPKNRRLFYISRAVKDNVIASKLEKFFSEDELVQLTKFEKKADIFKIGLEEWM